jgi:lipopolysaccharide transport system permease protein
VSQKGLEFDSLGQLPERPVVVNDARESQPAIALRELWNYRDLLYFLTWRDIRVRYKQTAIGAAWAIIQPFFLMLTFALFFGLLVGMPNNGMPYLVFFYCGLMPWTFFSAAITTSHMSLVGNSHLITKVYFPRIVLPIAATCALLVDLLIMCAILLGLVFYYGMGITKSFALVPALLVLTVFLALDFGIWLAALTVKYRDIRHALPFILQLWMFLTPVVYPLSIVPEKWRWVMFLNPLTGVVEGLRSAVAGQELNWAGIQVSIAISIGMFLCSIYAFRRLEKSFADLI